MKVKLQKVIPSTSIFCISFISFHVMKKVDWVMVCPHHDLVMIMTTTWQIHLRVDIKAPFSEEWTEDASDHCTTAKVFTCKEGIRSGTCVFLLWRLTRWEAAALVDVRDVSGFTCPRKAKHKQSAQLQPWEFWLKQMKFQNIHRQLFNSGFGPSDSSLRTLALNVGVVTQIWATKKHWYIPGPSKGRQVVPEGCQFTTPFGFN